MCSLLGASEGSNSAIVRDERAVDATHMGEDNDVSSPPKSGILHTYAENAAHRYWLASLKNGGCLSAWCRDIKHSEVNGSSLAKICQRRQPYQTNTCLIRHFLTNLLRKRLPTWVNININISTNHKVLPAECPHEAGAEVSKKESDEL